MVVPPEPVPIPRQTRARPSAKPVHWIEIVPFAVAAAPDTGLTLLKTTLDAVAVQVWPCAVSGSASPHRSTVARMVKMPARFIMAPAGK
ncbi:hypothetical protein GCM10009078_49720 [Cupriavidus gilardii]